MNKRHISRILLCLGQLGICLAITLIFISAYAESIKNYYQILDVSPNATYFEIKKKFRQLAKKYHPDINHGDKQKEELFKNINESYAVLSNPEKRKKLDRDLELDLENQEDLANSEILQTFNQRQGEEAYAAAQRFSDKVRQTHAINVVDIVKAELRRHAKDSMKMRISNALKIIDRNSQNLTNLGLLKPIWHDIDLTHFETIEDLYITEAVLKASFLWLKNVQRTNTKTYEELYDYGIYTLKKRLGRKNAHVATDSDAIQILVRVMIFANEYKNRDWEPPTLFENCRNALRNFWQ
ncbi:MAG: hypothetical protein A2Z20_09340 [Bdellovibrionales bacterium RBG_16_40_8]|nr:MAG: hypothetical protein A2Z20_09340 [Bdellovibrionales bacterium RBG_16_40_8]